MTTPSLGSLSFDNLTPKFTVRVRGGVDVEIGLTRDERLRLRIVQDGRALESARRHPWGRDQHARILAGFGRTVEVCGRKGAAQPRDGAGPGELFAGRVIAGAQGAPGRGADRWHFACAGQVSFERQGFGPGWRDGQRRRRCDSGERGTNVSEHLILPGRGYPSAPWPDTRLHPQGH